MRALRTGRHRQRGVALITAVFIVALAATIAAYLSLGQQLWLRQAQNLNDRAQADAVADGAFSLAMLVLDDDRKRSAGRDDLGEDWAQRVPPLPVEGGMVAVSIEDAQGRFNLNSLMRAGQPSQPDIGVLQRLLALAGLDYSLVDALIDWMDADLQPRPSGAEDSYYMNLSPAYRAANRPMTSIEELRLVRGFTPEDVERLRPWLTVLPEPTDININTAPAEVLSALFVALPLSEAQRLVDERNNGRPFTDKTQLAERAGQAPVDKVAFDIQSSYFLARADSRVGRLNRRTQALLHRPASGGSIQLVWRAQRL